MAFAYSLMFGNFEYECKTNEDVAKDVLLSWISHFHEALPLFNATICQRLIFSVVIIEKKEPKQKKQRAKQIKRGLFKQNSFRQKVCTNYTTPSPFFSLIDY